MFININNTRRMSNKGNFMNEYRDWITNQRMKLVHGQNKVILPRLSNEENRQNSRKNSMKKREDEMIMKGSKDLSGLDSSRGRYNGEGKSTTLKSTGNDSTIFKEDKCDIVKEIKTWIKVIEKADKDDGKLNENTLQKLQNSLYKWCFGIQQLYNSYQKLENDHGTPTKAPSLRAHAASDDTTLKLPDLCEIQLKNQKEVFEKDIKRLSIRNKELQTEMEMNRANSLESLGKINELEILFVDCIAKIKENSSKDRELRKSIGIVLKQNETFLNQLKQSIASGNVLTNYLEKIDEELSHLKTFKQSNCINI